MPKGIAHPKVFMEMSDASRYRHIIKLRDGYGLKFRVIGLRIGLSAARACQLYKEATEYFIFPTEVITKLKQ